MSGHEKSNLRFLLFWAGGVVLLAALCAGLGYFLGVVVSPGEVPPPGTLRPEAHGAPEEEVEYTPDPEAPPFFFHAGVPDSGDWTAVAGEAALARSAGFHQYVVELPPVVPWPGGAKHREVEARLARYVEVDPEAAFLLTVSLNPEKAWLDQHPGVAFSLGGKTFGLPTPASEAWRDEAGRSLEALVKGLEQGPHGSRVIGYILTALSEGQWRLASGFDTSLASNDGFRRWLERRYVSDEALRRAWGSDAIAFEIAQVPERPDTRGTQKVFLTLPEQQPVADYMRYASESVADAIAACALACKAAAGIGKKVLVPYGFSCELAESDAGHYALALLLNSDVDGFISPVSYADRALGSAGAPMAPISSAVLHSKEWYLVDDTRTGVTWNARLGKAARIKGLRPEDVYNVQRRNFALAMVHGLGIIWSDPAGLGWLHDEGQWREFGRLRDIRARLFEAEPAQTAPPASSAEEEGAPPALEQEAEAIPGDAPPLDTGEETGPPATQGGEPEQHPEEGEASATATPLFPLRAPTDKEPVMAVVIDEDSRCYQQPDAPLQHALLHAGRDAALRAGIATRFVLLSDVVDDTAASFPLYLFLNAFRLTEAQRSRLHGRFEREHACAIWLYAPGYIAATMDEKNVAATTRMAAHAYGGPSQSGSLFTLAGRWLKAEDALGTPQVWDPLFYIDDKEADTLATYKLTGETSMAMRVLEEGWTTVFVAEPYLSPELLCEILRILEQHLFFPPDRRNFFDAVHAGQAPRHGSLLAVHARQVGERQVSLARFRDVQDLFEPALGWPQKESFRLHMKNGETRLFLLRAP